jgi:FMN phosphatase YigB (HAD superfamily)
MIKAVLLDLDDTLLRLETQQFVERYVQTLEALIQERYAAVGEAGIAVGKAMRAAIRATIDNLDPTQTNRQVYADVLSRRIGLPLEALQSIFDEFHAGAYQTLSGHVTPIPVAPGLVRRLFEMGLAVVIATNPLFPLAAVLTRMAWGGLGAPPAPYALVTNMDDMHFTKPSPHYYEEILARVGVEADEAIMVGDSFMYDIAPAARAGLNTFWVEWGNPPDDPEADLALADGRGTLEDFDRLVGEGWLSSPQPRPRTADQVAPRMLGDVAALFGMVAGMDPAYWNRRPDPKEWSPLELVRHLGDSERDEQRPRLERIAAEDNPFISQPPAPPEPGEQDFSAASAGDGLQAMHDFWDERCRTLEFLKTLRPEQWSRPARHSIFGPTTLLEMAHFTTRHDHLHLIQFCQIIGRCKQE